jgi:polyhydroxyalkanoate synthesis regulator phasin
MSNSISDDFKEVLLAGIGAMAVTAEKTQQIVEKLIKKGELTVEQGKVLNEELRHKAKEKVKETISKSKLAVESVIDNLDKMSEEEIAALKAKLADMEKPDAEK